VTLRCLNTTIKTVIADGLHGSYDLIYSAGLFDYLKDRTARAAGAGSRRHSPRAVRR